MIDNSVVDEALAVVAGKLRLGAALSVNDPHLMIAQADFERSPAAAGIATDSASFLQAFRWAILEGDAVALSPYGEWRERRYAEDARRLGLGVELLRAVLRWVFAGHQKELA